jgi:hypothetical protein
MSTTIHESQLFIPRRWASSYIRGPLASLQYSSLFIRIRMHLLQLLEVPIHWTSLSRSYVFVIMGHLQLLLLISKVKRPRCTGVRYLTVGVAVLQKRQWTQAPARGT